MRVVINAQLDPKTSGGIAQVILGLGHALGKLDGPEEYVFVCSPESKAWLAPYLGRNSRIEVNTTRKPPPARGVREPDGFWESFSPNVIHFPYQSYTRTGTPTIFNPHDLQHVHLPHLFSDEERARREALYGEACQLCSAVATTSAFVKDDVVRHFGVAPAKVHVIWWGAPSNAYETPSRDKIEQVLRKYGLPNRFVIYPAQTWPHKNHELLLTALHHLRLCGVKLFLVCTGAKTEHYAALAEQVTQHGLDDQVRFLGWVKEDNLMALYHAAEMMVVPTRFEAISMPVFEAFAEGIPVTCSTVTSLPEQVGNAALLFDPADAEAAASAMLRLHEDEKLRHTLIEHGHERLAQFSWTTTACKYRELYRSVAFRRKIG